MVNDWKPVIGLEIHIQLKTKSKNFSPEGYEYGAEPNTLTHPVSLAYPGTLPVVNKKVIEYATLLGLALNATIRKRFFFSRKNYFYPDLPKGYQITQYETPICENGYLHFKTGNTWKKVRIQRIQIEEDTGKSIHDIDPFYTLLDFNRAGVPLLELVTAPDINSPEEAQAFLIAVRQLVRHLGISDGNMEEGSLRCDANISLIPPGHDKPGNRVEVKNLNSFRFLRKALEYEIERQKKIYESGGTVDRETRGFDAVKGVTFSMRTKEELHDYRYFPEPDMPPFELSETTIKKLKAQLPPLPYELWKRYREELNLSEKEADFLIEDLGISRFFERALQTYGSPKSILKWLMGPVRAYLNQNSIDISDFPIPPETLARLAELVDKDVIHFTVASQKLFPLLVKEPDKNPETLIKELALDQKADESFIEQVVREVLDSYPEKIEQYHKGKTGLLGLFIGESMKKLRGKADPRKVREVVVNLLNERK